MKVFLKNLGKEVEVAADEVKNLFHQGLVSGEDYVKSVAARVVPGFKQKGEEDVAKAKAEVEAAEAKAKADAAKVEADAEAKVEAAKADAEKAASDVKKDM